LSLSLSLSFSVISRTFRRDSLKEEGIEVIESWRIPGIFGQMGQHFEQKDLEAALKKLDPTGKDKKDNLRRASSKSFHHP